MEKTTIIKEGISLGQMLAASREFADREVSGQDAVDAKPATRIPWARLVVLSITLGYAWFELRWNINLVNAIASGADKGSLTEIVDAGRWLTAFGLVWAVSKGVPLKPTQGLNKAAHVLCIALAVCCVHSVLETVFESIIDSMSPSSVMKAHEASVYRFMNANRLSDPATAVLVPLLAFSDAGRKKLDDAYALAPLQAEQNVDRMMSDIGPEFDKLKAGVDPSQLAQFEEGYRQYISGSNRIERGLRMFQDAARERFKAATGGMDPNGSASRVEFARQLAGSRMIEKRLAAQKYLHLQAAIAGAQNKLSALAPTLQLSDVELVSVSREDLRGKLVEAATAEIKASLPEEGQIKSNAAGRAGAQAAIIPLFAMVLSLAGISANIGAAAGLLVGSTRFIFPLLGLAVFFGAGLFFESNPFIAQCTDLNPVILHAIKSAVFIESRLV